MQELHAFRGLTILLLVCEYTIVEFGLRGCCGGRALNDAGNAQASIATKNGMRATGRHGPSRMLVGVLGMPGGLNRNDF